MRAVALKVSQDAGWPCWRTGAQLLRNILTSVPSEDFVNKGLVSDAAPACFLAELFEDSGIDSDRDQLARLVAERRPANAPHRLQLLRG
jgi:hypothetical protein